MRYEKASGECFGCGEPADAVWSGSGGEVRVCRTCAVKILSALIADAVWVNPAAKPAGFTAHLTAVEAAYWRAAACRISAEAKPRPDF